jgi:hypothetical protein
VSASIQKNSEIIAAIVLLCATRLDLVYIYIYIHIYIHNMPCVCVCIVSTET